MNLVVAFLLAAVWPQNLWLDRGGYWTERVQVAVSNTTDKAWDEMSVAVEIPALKEARKESFRLQAADGKLILFKVVKPGEFVVPVTVDAQAETSFTFYAGNALAWNVADEWKKKANPKCGAVVRVGALEKLGVTEEGADAPWLTEGEWEYRVPVRVCNMTDEMVERAFSSVPAAEVFHATRNPISCMTYQGKKVVGVSIGTTYFFFAHVPPKTIRTYYLYVKHGKALPKQVAHADASVLGSEIPSDQVYREKMRLTEDLRASYEKMLLAGVNLVKNGNFAEGEAHWRQSPAAKGMAFDLVEEGLFAKKCARFKVEEAAAKGWKGRYQMVNVTPGKSYLFGGFVKTIGMSDKPNIYLHFVDDAGKHRFDAAAGTLKMPNALLAGDNDWTPLFGSFTVGANIHKVEVHLTMPPGTGTILHDGIFVAEKAMEAHFAEPEPCAFAAGKFGTAQVPAMIKVFPEYPVKEDGGASMEAPYRVSLARGETEDLQVAIKAGDSGLVTFSVEAPTHSQSGATLETELGVVGLVKVDYPSSYFGDRTKGPLLRIPKSGPSSDGWSGMWPDPIRLTAQCDLPKNEARAVRVAITTHTMTKPGLYRGALCVKRNGVLLRRDPFEVTVWNFEVPERPSFAATYDVRFDGRQKALWFAPGEKDLAPTKKRIQDVMAKYKICPDRIDAKVEFKRAADGNVTADFTEYDKQAKEFFEHYQFPDAYTPNSLYIFGWGHPPRAFLGEKPYEGEHPYTNVNRRVLRPAYKKAYQAAAKLFWDHVKEKGWADRIAYYISDEPYIRMSEIRDQMIAVCEMIHEVDPTIRIYSSTWRHCPEWDKSLDIWGVGAYGCFPTNEMVRLSKAGSEIWITTDGQQCLDVPWCAIERMQPLYCWAYGATKYEFWGCNWFTYNPWEYGWHSFIPQSGTPGDHFWTRYPNGDGYHIYPPENPQEDAMPSPSVRLCAIRDGVEEYSYYRQLEALAADGKQDAKKRKEAAALCEAYRALVPIPNAGGRHGVKILPHPEILDELRARTGTLLNAK